MHPLLCLVLTRYRSSQQQNQSPNATKTKRASAVETELVVREGHPDSMRQCLQWHSLTAGDKGQKQLRLCDVICCTAMSCTTQDMTQVTLTDGLQSLKMEGAFNL